MNNLGINFERPSRPAILILIGTIFTALFTGAVIGQEQPLLLAFFFVPLLTIILFTFPYLSLAGIFVGIYSLDWLSRVLSILPTQVRWFPEAVIFLMLGYIFSRRSANHKFMLRKTPIDPYFIGLIIVGLLSTAVNYAPLLTVLSGFRNLLRPLLLYYVIVNLALDKKYLKRLIIMFFILELLQIPVAYYQFLIYGGGDQASGTLGANSGQMTVLLASIFMSLFLGLAIVKKSIVYALTACLLFLPILFSEGKAGFFVIPFMVLFLFSFNSLATSNNKIRASIPKYAIVFVPMVVIVYGLSLWLVPIVIPNSPILSFLENPAMVFEQYEAPLSRTNGIPASRTGDIQFAWLQISQGPQYTLFGYGPGETSNGIQGIGVGSLFNKYAENPRFWLGDPRYKYTYYAFTQISAMLQEFGIIGLILYLLMLLAVFRENLKFANRPDIDPFWRGINLGFSGALFAFVVYSTYYRVWFWEAGAYVFWGLAAVIYSYNSLPKPTETLATSR